MKTLLDSKTERNVIWLLSAVQLVNILDFMMVMPLGPDFADALNVPASDIGVVGGSYTAAAAISGFIASFFLDRFDRKKAVVFCLVGLVIGTFSGGFAVNLSTLIMARILAGIFGGPAASLSLAMVADIIPIQRRGKALGKVMGAFSIASVLGVPLGLELAHHGNWQTPFFALSAFGLLITMLLYWKLPNFRFHLAKDGAPRVKRVPLLHLLSQSKVLLSYSAISSSMVATFLIIPNIAAYVQINLGFPRAHMGFLYMWGGLASFITMRLSGKTVDRKGSLTAACVGTILMLSVLYMGFYHYFDFLPVAGIFILFMMGNAFRNVAFQSFASLVPEPQERASYMSIQSTVQHLSCALGAFLSAHFLHLASNGHLDGMKPLVACSMGLALLMPLAMFLSRKAPKDDDSALEESSASHSLA